LVGLFVLYNNKLPLKAYVRAGRIKHNEIRSHQFIKRLKLLMDMTVWYNYNLLICCWVDS